MTSAKFTVSAFGDEIADDLEQQLRLLQELRVHHLEFRSAWGTNVLHLSDEEVASVKDICGRHGIKVSCIGSPIGKSPIMDPIEREESNLSRIMQVARILDTSRVRIFSFYPPNGEGNADNDEFVNMAVSRLSRLAKLAQRDGIELLLENEKGIVGDTPERCLALVSGVENPHLRFLWDPANFVQVGVSRPMTNGWPLLADYVTYIHVKDAFLSDGKNCAAGEGDGQLLELLVALNDAGYKGVLALEPHLAIAGHSGGFSGEDGMRYAVDKLRHLLEQVGAIESAT